MGILKLISLSFLVYSQYIATFHNVMGSEGFELPDFMDVDLPDAAEDMAGLSYLYYSGAFNNNNGYQSNGYYQSNNNNYNRNSAPYRQPNTQNYKPKTNLYQTLTSNQKPNRNQRNQGAYHQPKSNNNYQQNYQQNYYRHLPFMASFF